MVHQLKVDPFNFKAVMNGTKTFELRLNDKDFTVDDVLILREFDERSGYTGRETDVLVLGVFGSLEKLGLPKGTVIMSISRMMDVPFGMKR